MNDHCDLHDWPLYQCPPECRTDHKPSSGWTESAPPAYDGPRPGTNDVLISQRGIAHLAGCSHLPYHPWLVPPKWGWTHGRQAFQTLGPGRPLRAEQGNTRLTAERRCSDCDA